MTARLSLVRNIGDDRDLSDDYVVQHIDGDLSNNRLENLRVVRREEHGMSRAVEESQVERTIRTGAKWTAQANNLSAAKDLVQQVMDDFPTEVCGSTWLEEAIELIGRAEREIDDATQELIEGPGMGGS